MSVNQNIDIQFGVTAQDPFGIVSQFGSNMELQNYSAGVSNSAVVADSQRGEYVPESAATTDGRVAMSASYQSKTIAAGAFTGVTLGIGGRAPEAIESIEISAQKGAHLTISASGHRHTGGSRVRHNRTLRHVELPTMNGFGAQNFGLDIGIPEEALQSATYTLAIGHTDDADKDGNFLCGTSHGVTITVAFEAIDPTAWNISGLTEAGWRVTAYDQDPTQTATSHQTRNLTCVRYLGDVDIDRSFVPAETCYGEEEPAIVLVGADGSTGQSLVPNNWTGTFASTDAEDSAVQWALLYKSGSVHGYYHVTVPSGYSASIYVANGSPPTAGGTVAATVTSETDIVAATLFPDSTHKFACIGVKLLAGADAATVEGNISARTATVHTPVTLPVAGTVTPAE